MDNSKALYNVGRMALRPLSEVIEKFNKDKSPLDRLEPSKIHKAIQSKPIQTRKKRKTDKGQEIIVKRDTRGGRLPYRLADAGQKVIEAVRLGATYRLAAQYAGIQINTLYRWLQIAEQIIARLENEANPVIEESEVIYVDFYIQLQEAEGNAVVEWLGAISAAAMEQGKWQAAAWLLERRHPQDFGKRTEVHQHHTSGVATLDDWQKKAKNRRLEAAEIINELEAIEDADYRELGLPAPSQEGN